MAVLNIECFARLDVGAMPRNAPQFCGRRAPKRHRFCSITACHLSDPTPIGTLDTEIISTPGRIWRRLKNRSSDLRTIGLAIWKAVAMAPVFRSLGEVKACGGGDLATVASAVPAWSRESFRLGEVSFWGDFTTTGAIATAFQIAVLAALGCGEFCRRLPAEAGD